LNMGDPVGNILFLFFLFNRLFDFFGHDSPRVLFFLFSG
jgi:hypothetical protein